jgi:hypothetical protein
VKQRVYLVWATDDVYSSPEDLIFVSLNKEEAIEVAKKEGAELVVALNVGELYSTVEPVYEGLPADEDYDDWTGWEDDNDEAPD